MDAQVTPLSERERGWLHEQLEAARRFLADYGAARPLAPLAALDHAWASWLDRQQVDPADPEPVINAVGVALGQALVDALDGFDWVIARDEEGTDLAVSGPPDAGDVLFYPAAFVAARYEARTSGFLQDTVATMIAQIGQRRAHPVS